MCRWYVVTAYLHVNCIYRIFRHPVVICNQFGRGKRKDGDVGSVLLLVAVWVVSNESVPSGLSESVLRMVIRTDRMMAQYGAALIATAAAVGIRWLLDAWLGDDLPLVSLFGAVAASVWFGGYGPAVFSALAGWMACDYLFIEPRYHITTRDAGSVIGLAAFLMSSGVIIGFGDALYRGRRQARAAEDRLRQSEEELSDFFDNAPVGLHWVGSSGTILRANRAQLEMLGYTSEEYVGHKIVEFHVDEDLIRDVLRRLAAGETIVDQDAQMWCKNGSARDVMINSNTSQDEHGRLMHSRCFTTDVSAQRRGELASQRLAAIVESSEDAIVAKDLHGVVTEWNKAAGRIFGYTADEMIGRPIRILIPAERADEESEILDRIKKGIRVEHFESIRLRKDGSSFPVSLTISPILDPQGKVVGASKIARDITALKMAEHALIDADRGKDDFLAALAHELRNPLAPIRNALEQLKLDTGLDARSVSSRDVIDRQSQIMARLMDDLLDVSRISRNRLEIRKEYTTLAAVIEAAVETSRPLIEQGKHIVSLSMPAEPIHLDADPTRLTQVFSNVLNNAAKFMEPGGSIQVVAALHEAQVLVSVKDTGMGIPGASLPRIFELFAQTPPAQGMPSGLGVGLALARSVLRAHDGSIEAHSEGKGKGSEFIVSLPVSPHEPEFEETHSDPPIATPSRRVLIVDDNRDNAETMAVLLRMSGHVAELAYDGEAALEVAERFSPDLILLDLGMPTIDGLETCRRLRAQAWTKNIQIVALTGLGQPEDRRRTLEAGFDDHLLKPVGFSVLQTLLRDLKRERAEG